MGAGMGRMKSQGRGWGDIGWDGTGWGGMQGSRMGRGTTAQCSGAWDGTQAPMGAPQGRDAVWDPEHPGVLGGREQDRGTAGTRGGPGAPRGAQMVPKDPAQGRAEISAAARPFALAARSPGLESVP